MFTVLRGEHYLRAVYCVFRTQVSVAQCRLFSAKVETSGRAAFLEEYKKPLVIKPLTSNKRLADDKVRIAVSYCCLNHYDIQYIAGVNKPRLPYIPGSEISGTVLEVGSKCTQGLKVGDNVVALLAKRYKGGGLSTECVVNETECQPIGKLSLEEAAVLLQSHGSAHLAFSQLCHLKEKDNIIIFAGIGGDGLAAIEIANKVYKATVYAVCDSDSSKALLREDIDIIKAINAKAGITKTYKTLDNCLLNTKIKAVYDGVSCGLLHVASDFVDPSGHFLTSDPLYYPEMFPSSKPDFKKVTTKHKHLNPTDIQTYDELTAKIKRVDLTDYQLKDPSLYQKIVREVFDMYSNGMISPYVSKTFTLHDVNKAVKFAQAKKCVGKILINVASRATE